MITTGSTRFGGLSFADNDIKLAQPNYDIYAQNSAALANKWQANKTGAEQTVDYIEAQSVRNKDSGIKKQTSDRFIDAIKPFVETGRYEDATYALDESVRTLKKDKAFNLAVNNYAEYAEWAQAQRDYIGWDEKDKDAYLAAEEEDYKGVQVHKDGSISGSFNGRDMGEYVNFKDIMFDKLKAWKPDITDQQLNDVYAGVGFSKEDQGGVLKNNYVGGTKRIEQNNLIAMVNYATDYMNEDPAMKHFLSTKRIINDHKDPRLNHADFTNGINSSAISQQRFGQRLSELRKGSDTAAFNKDYAVIDNKGNAGSKADYQVYTTTEYLRRAGANQLIDSWQEEGLTAGQKFQRYEAAMSNYAEAISPNSKVDIDDINNRYAKFGKESLTATEQMIRDGATFKQLIAGAEIELYKADQSYNSSLPFAGKTITLDLNSWTDKGVEELMRSARKTSDDAAGRLSPLATYNLHIVSTPEYNAFQENGSKGYKELMEANKGLASSKQVELFGLLGDLNATINKENETIRLANKGIGDDANKRKEIPLISIPNDPYQTKDKQALYSLINLSETHRSILNNQPALANQFNQTSRSLANAFNAYTNQEAVYEASKSYKDGENDVDSYEAIYAKKLAGKLEMLNADERRDIEYVFSGDANAKTFTKDDLTSDELKKLEDASLKRSKSSAKYIEQHITTGLTPAVIDFSGFYETGNEKEDVAFRNIMTPLTNNVADIIKGGKATYTVRSNGKPYGDQYGGEFDKGTWSLAKDIKDIQLRHVRQSSTDAFPIYTFKASMDTPVKDMLNMSDDKIDIEFIDETGVMDQLRVRLLSDVNSLGKDDMVRKNAELMSILIAGEGKVNIVNAQQTLLSSGKSDVIFTAPNGRQEKAGTFTKELGKGFARDANGNINLKDKDAAILKDGNFMNIRYDYEEVKDSVLYPRFINFGDNYTEAAKFALKQREEAYTK